MKKRRQGKERKENDRLEKREGREDKWREQKEKKTGEERREEMIQKMHAREIGKPRSCVFSILCPRILRQPKIWNTWMAFEIVAEGKSTFNDLVTAVQLKLDRHEGAIRAQKKAGSKLEWSVLTTRLWNRLLATYRQAVFQTTPFFSLMHKSTVSRVAKHLDGCNLPLYMLRR